MRLVNFNKICAFHVCIAFKSGYAIISDPIRLNKIKFYDSQRNSITFANWKIFNDNIRESKIKLHRGQGNSIKMVNFDANR